MGGLRSNPGAALVLLTALWVAMAALHGLLKPVSNGCAMTYMYPNYVPIATNPGKYGLFLYREGWGSVGFDEHLKGLSGVPVLFVPGNGGSYKQVRSLGAESHRAYQRGPLKHTHFQEASLLPEEVVGGGMLENMDDFVLPSKYTRMTDWFAVDLKGEHSAMDGRIIEGHTEYVVYSIHRILDLYKESKKTRAQEGAAASGSLPKSVILVGHSMGGFVARAAVVHPNLRKSAVVTVISLSSPHRSPPVALQPSLGLLYSQVNKQWNQGYKVKNSHSGGLVSDPMLSNVVVVSISGGFHDYQVRSRLVSLDGIVPSTHGFTINSMSMKYVWLSMEHQVILWCNQLVIQVSHTLLSIIDPETGRPFHNAQRRMDVLSKMLRSGVPQSFNWMNKAQSLAVSAHDFLKRKYKNGLQNRTFSPCPESQNLAEEGLEKDLYIQGTTVSVLAADGKRRWMDIKKLQLNGKSHFMLVTNLIPCSGIRIHLWPEKGHLESEIEPADRRVFEVTTKMVQIPTGPAPRQIELGSQPEQVPPSAVLKLTPQDMEGFRFLTIFVAPQSAISGQSSPATCMVVGQFYKPEDGEEKIYLMSLLSSSYFEKEFFLNEEHPLSLNLSLSISLSLVPVILSIETAGCSLPTEQARETEQSSLCNLHCFSPVAFAWDHNSGLVIVPNLYSDTITMDSSPGFLDSSKESDRNSIMLLVDPRCSYKIGVSMSLIGAASRFLLLYCSQIIGFSMSVVFYAMMRQSRCWELDLPVPSMLTAVELNLRVPVSFLLLALAPVLISLVLTVLAFHPLPPFLSFITVSLICYTLANGFVVALILIFQLGFYVATTATIALTLRWQAWGEKCCFMFLRHFMSIFGACFSFKIIRILEKYFTIAMAITAFFLVFFIHPALGLFLLLFSQAISCHAALCSQVQREESCDSGVKGDGSMISGTVNDSNGMEPLPLSDLGASSVNLKKSSREMQSQSFNFQHGLLILHTLAALMFFPSLVAWSQRISTDRSFPKFVDSALCAGVILQGLLGRQPGFLYLPFSHLGGSRRRFGLTFIYLLSGYYCYLSALDSAPYKAFYVMALMGGISLVSKIMRIRNGEKGNAYLQSRGKHLHIH